MKAAGWTALFSLVLLLRPVGAATYSLSAESGSSVLEGITATDGYETLSGGGIGFQNASPTIWNCVLRGNTTECAGGGLSLLNNATATAIVVADCEFSENSARTFGGGVYAVVPADSVVDVRGCLFSGNEVAGESSGLAAGGVWRAARGCSG